MTGDVDPQRWSVPGGPASAADDLDLTRVSTRAEARALAEAVAQQPPPVAAAPSRPVAPARVPSPHVPAPAAPGQWGAAAPTPPRPYTPVTPPPPAAPPPPLKASRSGLSLFGTVVRALSFVSAAACGVGALGALSLSNVLTATGPGSFADGRSSGLPGWTFLSLLVAAAVGAIAQVCFMVWLAMVAADPRADRRRIKHGPVGTILGFLLPGVRLWWPYQSMRDAWRATDLRPAGKPTPMSIVWWWAFTTVGSLAISVSYVLARPSLLDGDQRGFLAVFLLGVAVTLLLNVAALVCLSFAIGRVCFHLDAHDLLREHHARSHASWYGTAASR